MQNQKPIVAGLSVLISVLAVTVITLGWGLVSSRPGNNQVAAPSPLITIAVTPSTLSPSGPASATLAWRASLATSCTASGGWSGSQPTSGSLTVAPNRTTTYTLTCLNGSNSVSRSAVLTVDDLNQIITATAGPNGNIKPSGTVRVYTEADQTFKITPNAGYVISSLRVDGAAVPISGTYTFREIMADHTIDAQFLPQNSTATLILEATEQNIDPEDSTVLIWTATNANSCTASGGWSGTRGTSGSLTISPNVTTTYTLTCLGLNNSSISRSVTVLVNSAPVPAPTLTFSAAPTSITSGQSSTLTWVSGNASSCTASGAWSGTKTLSGSFSVTPTSNATYTLTCANSAGATIVRSATVTVTTPPPAVACNNNLDDDSDGLTDYPADPGCTSATDTDEFNLPPTGDTRSSVTQHGITWTFDTNYRVGQFANGDWWVVPNTSGGTVVITRITPDRERLTAYNDAGNSTGLWWMHGWMVNPSRLQTVGQAFDERAYFNNWGANPTLWRPDLTPSLPYAARGGQSIVKAISDPTGICSGEVNWHETNGRTENFQCVLKTAGVLTVLNSVPANNGATVFRPPYLGSEKPLYSTTNLRLNLLPELTQRVPYMPTLAQAARYLQRLQLDVPGSYMTDIHPDDNMGDYGSIIAPQISDSILRLYFDDPIEQKMPGVIYAVQAGIDWAHQVIDGNNYAADGAHHSGRKLGIMFAALLLNHPTLTAVSQAPWSTYNFAENCQTYYDNNSSLQTFYGILGFPRYGQYHCANPADPGYNCEALGNPGCLQTGTGRYYSSYRGLNSPIWIGEALVIRLIQGELMWNHNAFLDYVDRWVTEHPTAPTDYNWNNYVWDLYRPSLDLCTNGVQDKCGVMCNSLLTPARFEGETSVDRGGACRP
jgi:hypothetical protein